MCICLKKWWFPPLCLVKQINTSVFVADCSPISIVMKILHERKMLTLMIKIMRNNWTMFMLSFIARFHHTPDHHLLDFFHLFCYVHSILFFGLYIVIIQKVCTLSMLIANPDNIYNKFPFQSEIYLISRIFHEILKSLVFYNFVNFCCLWWNYLHVRNNILILSENVSVER